DAIRRRRAGGDTALRHAGGNLRACRWQGCEESPSDPQGATLELHEAAERSCRTTDQPPRDQGHRWYPPVDSIWCEQMSELIQRERTGFMCLCFLCVLLFRILDCLVDSS